MVETSEPDCSTSARSNALKSSNDTKQSSYVYHEVRAGNFCFSSYEKVLLASISTRPSEQVAIRIRHGSAGYAHWMNELHCYLLPNFKHKNILQYYGSHESHSDESSKFSKLGEYVRYLDDDYEHPRAQETIKVVASSKHVAPRMEEGPPPMDSLDETIKIGPFRIEYWLMTRFCDSMTLRDFLISNTITWPQMIKITKGIMRGLYFLHENHEYQNFNNDNLIDSFINSTNGALRRVAFKDSIHVLHMKPHINLTITHRNLCSKNIVLKRNLTPCIWNFGHAYIHHPFQPTNHYQLIDEDTKRMHLLSQYSAPEVLQQKGNMSLAAMKSIDMYASGIVMWELISRCVLPKMKTASQLEHRERDLPDDYVEPLDREFGKHRDDPSFIDYVVCNLRVRPRLKSGWLAGRKTSRYVQTMRDLWDPDFDARLHPATVIARLNGTSLSDRDIRNRYVLPLEKMFLAETTNWPNDRYMGGFQVPTPNYCLPIKVFDDYSELPASKKPPWISSDSDQGSETEDKFDEAHSKALMRNYELLRARKIRAQARARRQQMHAVAKISTPSGRQSLDKIDSISITMTTVENSFEMISITDKSNKVQG